MKKLTKAQKARKETQIKALINTSLDYFYAEDLLEMLMNECPQNGKDDLLQKFREVITLDGDILIESNLATDRMLSDFCKQNDIKLKGFFDL